MARTKASVGAKVSSGKSNKARCSVVPQRVTSVGSDRSPHSGGGAGNSVCPRETPKWQRAITTFFNTKHKDGVGNGDKEAASSSKPKSKRNIIESDDEAEPLKNNELDETIDLEALTGADSHNIEEYFPKNEKGKGVGKKTKITETGKENTNNNIKTNNKREREDTLEESVSKRVKI